MKKLGLKGINSQKVTYIILIKVRLVKWRKTLLTADFKHIYLYQKLATDITEFKCTDGAKTIFKSNYGYV